MRLNEDDVARLVTSCKLSQETTGSEYIWDEYERIIEKLHKLCEQGYCSIKP